MNMGRKLMEAMIVFCKIEVPTSKEYKDRDAKEASYKALNALALE